MSEVAIRNVPVTARLLDIEEKGGMALAQALGVAEPPLWPPLYNDAESRAWFRRLLRDVPDAALWPCYYIIASIGAEQGERWVLAGIAGYKGPPDNGGVVEIGYSVVETFWRRGIATRAARQLVEQARAAGAKAVRAHTLIGGEASAGVLAKCGFHDMGVFQDPEDGPVQRFEIVFGSA